MTYKDTAVCIAVDAFLAFLARLLNQSSQMVCLSTAVPQKLYLKKLKKNFENDFVQK